MNRARPPLIDRRLRWGLLASLAVLAACGGGGAGPLTVPVDFAAEAAEWVVGASDYGDDTAPTSVTAVLAPQPSPLHGQGLRLSGDNRSDDLFAFVARPLDGLLPGGAYQVRWQATVVAEVPAGCYGVGGSPGEGVTIKAGVAGQRPQRVRVGDEWRFNLDKGDQTRIGPQAAGLGDLTSHGRDCVAVAPAYKTMTAEQAEPVRADAQGRV